MGELGIWRQAVAPRKARPLAPNLGTRALMNAIDEIAKGRGLVGARVPYKVNAAGEHVMALIFSSFERQ